MSGLHDSGVSPPRGRGCCCSGASALCKIIKGLLHVAVVGILFFMVFSGFADPTHSSGGMIALESVSYAVIAFLYIYTSSDRRERIISGIFLCIVATVIVSAAPSSKGKTAPQVAIASCNLVALSVYCFWKICALVQACRRRPRSAPGTAAAADPEAPLAPVQKEEATAAGGCSPSAPVQQTTFYIEDLPRKFPYDEICAMAGDFGNMVGRGGSGEVFRGLLDDGTAVAVKRISSDKPVGEQDFLREISIVANVHQRSLVRLLGYCLLRGGAGGQYLVYPFFEHGSLDWWLFNGEERRRLLPWPARRRIASDVARALAYLHHECRRQILHLDIKPANILLDGGLRAHVSDFGISMSIAQDTTSVDTRGRGTLGYMAPEIWVSSLSAKSDVYSYGVTLLELVTGHRGFEAGRDSSEAPPDLFARVVWEKTARGELMEVVDAAMASVDEGEVEAVVKVALCCVQHRRDLRPSMLTVVEMLEGRVAVDLPPESRLSVVDFMEPLSSPAAHNR